MAMVEATATTPAAEATPTVPTGAHDSATATTAGGRRRRRFSWSSVLLPVLAILVVFAVWELVIAIFDMKAYILPNPRDVFARMIDERSRLLEHTWPTLYEIGWGFALSALIGIPLAVLIVSSKYIDKAISPILVASQTVPKVAIAPLLIVWFGFGTAPKIIIAFLIAFFPVVISTSVGLRAVPGEMIDLARSMGAGHLSMFVRFRLPHALPSVFGGLKVAITLASIGAIVGEFVGSDKGLGYLLLVSNGRLDTEMLFAAIFVLVFIGIVLYTLVDVVERLVVSWQPPSHLGDASATF